MVNPKDIARTACPRCRAELDADDEFCRRCGAARPDPAAIEKIVCPRCCAVLDAADNYCRRCGAPTAANVAPAASSRQTNLSPPRAIFAPGGTQGALSESRWAVLLMLFAVLGPLAIPMLWRSSRFSRTWKAVLTVLVLALTVLLVWLLWYVVAMTLEPLGELKELKGF